MFRLCSQALIQGPKKLPILFWWFLHIVYSKRYHKNLLILIIEAYIYYANKTLALNPKTPSGLCLSAGNWSLGSAPGQLGNPKPLNPKALNPEPKRWGRDQCNHETVDGQGLHEGQGEQPWVTIRV